MEDHRFVVESTLVPHTAFETAMRRVKQCLSYSLKSPEPICLALVGESRTGKSRVLEETELLMPRSRTEIGAVVPILRVTAPSRPTVKGVAGLMLKALGDPKWESGTEIKLAERLEDQLGKCKTLMIMLDEFQHFFDKGTQKIFHDASDWLKTMVDSTKVTLVVSGLESCLPVLRRNEQLSGRFLAPVYMRRFNWLDDTGRQEFLGILEAFNDSMSMHFDMPPLHGDEMAFRFWCASGGLMGHLTKFLRQAVWDACDEGKRTITLEQFESAHKAAIWAESGGIIVDSPFDRKFSVEPTQEKIAFGLAVGVREVDTEPQKRGRSKRSGREAPLSQVLKGSGA
jgi:hypothetical protein